MIYATPRNQTTIMLNFVNTRLLLVEAAPAAKYEPCLQNPVLDGSRLGHTSALTARCYR